MDEETKVTISSGETTIETTPGEMAEMSDRMRALTGDVSEVEQRLQDMIIEQVTDLVRTDWSEIKRRCDASENKIAAVFTSAIDMSGMDSAKVTTKLGISMKPFADQRADEIAMANAREPNLPGIGVDGQAEPADGNGNGDGWQEHAAGAEATAAAQAPKKRGRKKRQTEEPKAGQE